MCFIAHIDIDHVFPSLLLLGTHEKKREHTELISSRSPQLCSDRELPRKKFHMKDKQCCPKWNAINLRITEKIKTTFCKKIRSYFTQMVVIDVVKFFPLLFFRLLSACRSECPPELWAIIVNY